MKIAGRKNDGAWYRTNKLLADLRDNLPAQIAALKSANNSNTELIAQAQAAFAEIQSLATTSGVAVNSEDAPSTAALWLNRMMDEGIPRQVWFGKYTFMTYSKVPAGGMDAHGNPLNKYVPDFGPQLFAFSKLLRRQMKNYVHALRGWRDQANVGSLGQQNPGGLPNADKTS